MHELNINNVIDYLRAQGHLRPGPARAELLGGGVSNLVFRIDMPHRAFVLKQSRPRLRTRDDWFSDLDRIYREQEVIEALHPLLPEVMPEVLFADRENYAFAMSAAPADHRVWKQILLAGEVDLALGELAGTILGRIHQATAGNQSLARPFKDHTVFVQLRVDPFYRRVQERRPEVAKAIEPLIEQMLTLQEALCHGDYTPKNLLVHQGRFTLVDYETAYLGDPTMDLGLFLAHVILKAFRSPYQQNAFFDLTHAFWSGYASQVRFGSRAELEVRGGQHFGACLLARIDGTSPVDYLPEESKREAVRRLARQVLGERPGSWQKILTMCGTEVSSLL
jgi:5-methylthioribose kinase